MINFPSIGVLPPGPVPFSTPLLVIGAPVLIGLGAALALIVVAVCAGRVRARQRPAARRRAAAEEVVVPYAAAQGGQ